MSRLVLSIDPGKNAHGCALWESGELLGAWYHRQETVLSSYIPPTMIDLVVYEFPQIRSLSRSKGGLKGQNDLLDVAYSAGVLLGRLELHTTPEFKRYTPRQWKGTAPKGVMVERIEARLSAEERERVELPSAKSLHHNVWDGVGIGLYYWGRL